MTGKQMELQYNINQIKKPPIRNNIQDIAAPREEIEKRVKRDRQLAEVGISTSNFDFFFYDGHEDEDVLEAMILVNEGKEIPQELKDKLLKKKQEIENSGSNSPIK
ncbi:MAG: hypothetical protein NC314_11685 [Roseburia sp.]|nr:hypothetical protein [Roseburia sp.]MCM1243493.1 hypothetical protein [Roseburia sp.]